MVGLLVGCRLDVEAEDSTAELAVSTLGEAPAVGVPPLWTEAGDGKSVGLDPTVRVVAGVGDGTFSLVLVAPLISESLIFGRQTVGPGCVAGWKANRTEIRYK